MRVRGAHRGFKALSRLTLIGIVGGSVAACSTDASRLSDPFSNPFSGGPTSTGSLGEVDDVPVQGTAIRTPRIQSQELSAPGASMSPRPLPRVAAPLPSSGPVAGLNPGATGLNPDAGRSMTPRVTPPAPQPRLQFGQGPKPVERDAAAKDAAARDAARKVEEAKAAEIAARKSAEASKAAELKKAAEASAKKAHVRPGQAAKPVDAKLAKIEPKADPVADKKAAAEAEAKAAKAEAAKIAAKKVEEAKTAEAEAKKAASDKAAATKVAAKEPEKAVAKPPAGDPPSTGSVNESFRWPAKGRVIAGYGSSGNEGINIAVPEGTPVKAAEEGTVAYAGSEVKGYGKLILVRHANGYVSAYAHNGEIDVKPGDKVKRGQVIAKSGASGNVTSPQLHFEIRKGATPVDPIPHLASN